MEEETNTVIQSMDECSITDNNFGKFIGKVNWFDKNLGYGFIDILNNNNQFSISNAFIHYTNINSLSQIKLLYPGEYVSCDLNYDDTNNKLSANNVTGVFGNKLLIENDTYKYTIHRKE